MLDAKNLTVFVTGASSGFGAATAKRFAQAGAKVVISGRRADRIEALKAEIGGDRVHAFTLDVQDAAAVKAAVDGLPAAFAEVDVLVNNAGLALGLGPAQTADLADWDTMIDTNVKGLVYCTRAILPGMVARDRGHIINLGSMAGTYPYPGANVYGATKAFVKQFSLNLRADVHGHRIRVTNLEPGMAESEFSEVRFKGDKGKAKDVYKGVQPMTPEDIAETIFFAATLPAHVNLNRIEMMPVMQAFGPLVIKREG
ncbi:3-hydroxy acid dehydrogenase/malonic semialdehyde reductase [Stella humosa]|uniref:3-hydroxy acid dehydrogenase/malonic semialdehyde reductase n=1 Tax=Stella humosa TaxID=94 RepID=A0A3N1MFX7_9PROT|nr:SDR family oxidoreductase [Stella humosa]ROQ01580.1 3-hydroxy acid dehydrogenase/malonic semialdehyde reductase [Stella humosa]BBK31960.1 NAD(P)-dependent oxidoreductase [Stella humosa]